MPKNLLTAMLLEDAVRKQQAEKLDFFTDENGVHPVRGSGPGEGERKSKETYKPRRAGEKVRYARSKGKKK